VLREFIGIAGDWVRGISPRLRWGVLVALVALVGVLAIRGASQESTGSGHRAGADGDRDGARLLTRDGRAVVGVARSTDGAAAAAIAYNRQRNALLTGGTSSAEAAEVAAAIATGNRDIGRDPASIPDRAAADNVDAALKTRSGELVWWTVPFGYRVRRYDEEHGRATVRVLSALLSASSSADDGPAAVSVSLRDVQLRWTNGRWRLWDIDEPRDQPQPTLVMALSNAPELHGQPVAERILRRTTENGAPLHAYLADARAFALGPIGAGPTDPGALDADEERVYAEWLVATAQTLDSSGSLGPDGGRTEGWQHATPFAWRETGCPPRSAERCWIAMGAVVGRQRARDPFTISLYVERLGVSESSGQRRAIAVPLTLEEEREILGGAVGVFGDVPEARAGSEAFQRGVVPLRPTIMERPR